jgi:hypothetical protein
MAVPKQITLGGLLFGAGTLVALIALAIFSSAILGPKYEGMIASRPVTCGTGQEYWTTDLPKGHNIFACTAPNTWTLTNKRLDEPAPYAAPVSPTRAKIDAMTDTERNCLGMWLKYNDVKASELTYSQAKQIQACDSLGMYHDLP